MNKEKAAIERERLFRIIEKLMLWENANNEQLLAEAREEICKSWRETCAPSKNLGARASSPQQAANMAALPSGPARKQSGTAGAASPTMVARQPVRRFHLGRPAEYFRRPRRQAERFYKGAVAFAPYPTAAECAGRGEASVRD